MPPGMPLAQAVSPAVTGGVTVVVLRETDLPPTPRATLSGFVRDGIWGRAPFLIADDEQLVEKVGAGGLHRDQPGADLDERRQDKLSGVRVTSIEEMASAAAGNADYILVELDWTTPDHALQTLSTFTAHASVPVVAGTDMPVEQVAPAFEAGASGIAICRPAMEAYDRTAACRAYRDAVDHAVKAKAGVME
jgi:thiamine monophosphate synthase